MSDLTEILADISADDPAASDRILPHVYDELRKLAADRLASEAPGHTLQATALVHEAYLRLVGETERQWNGRGHFFGAAAEAMRRIVIDAARRKKAVKRGGDRQRVPLNDPDAFVTQEDNVLAVDAAIVKLEQHDALAASLVKLRYFAGLTMAQSAEVLNISLRAAERNWTFAKAWLHAELAD